MLIDFQCIFIFKLFIAFYFDFSFGDRCLLSFAYQYRSWPSIAVIFHRFKFKIQNAKSKLRRKNPHATNPKNSCFRGKKNIQPIIYSVVWILHVVKQQVVQQHRDRNRLGKHLKVLCSELEYSPWRRNIIVFLFYFCFE